MHSGSSNHALKPIQAYATKLSPQSTAACRIDWEGHLRKLTISGRHALRAALTGAVRSSDQARFLHRLHCVVLAAEGFSCHQIAGWFGDDPRSVARWAGAFESAGTSGLMPRHAGGRPPRIDKVLAMQITGALRQSPGAVGFPGARWNASQVAQFLKASYGIELGVRQCQRLLKNASERPTAPDRPNHPPALR